MPPSYKPLIPIVKNGRLLVAMSIVAVIAIDQSVIPASQNGVHLPDCKEKVWQGRALLSHTLSSAV